MSMPGFSVPIHTSLTTPIMLAGVPRQFAIMNGTICAAMTFGLQTWVAIPICAIAHVAAAYCVKRDPYFFQTLVRHIRQKPYYKV